MGGVFSGIGSAAGLGGLGFTRNDARGSTEGISGLGWFSPGQANLGAGGGYGLGSGRGQTLSFIGDPLDIFGNRAQYTADTIAALQEQAAREGLAAQERNIAQFNALYSPYLEAGKQPLADLVAMSTGEYQFTPSQGFTQGVEQGGRSIRRAMAARGLLDSSATQASLADLVNALTEKDVAQQAENKLRMIRTAQDASRLIGGAETSQAGAASSIYSNLAAQNLQNAANLGQARQSAYSSAAGGLSGLAALLASR